MFICNWSLFVTNRNEHCTLQCPSRAFFYGFYFSPCFDFVFRDFLVSFSSVFLEGGAQNPLRKRAHSPALVSHWGVLHSPRYLDARLLHPRPISAYGAHFTRRFCALSLRLRVRHDILRHSHFHAARREDSKPGAGAVGRLFWPRGVRRLRRERLERFLHLPAPRAGCLLRASLNRRDSSARRLVSLRLRLQVPQTTFLHRDVPTS